MKTLLRYLLFSLVALGVASCIEDGYDTSASSQPRFSTDTLRMGMMFTGQPSPTSRFKVFNPHSKILSVSSISLRSGEASPFRINVDGSAGSTFSDIDIRPGDSIYVFVEATLPPTGSGSLTPFYDHIDFVTNGVSRSVVVGADGCDVLTRRGLTVSTSERWEAGMIYQVFDSLVVAPVATLTLAPGVQLFFHDGAELKVYGSLIADGTAEAPVEMRGDRTDNVLTDISFDLMASQWRGVTFAPSSRGNRLAFAHIRNTEQGITALDDSEVEFVNCRLRNSASSVLTGRHASLRLAGTEVAEAAEHLVSVTGGRLDMLHVTLANYYLFSAIRGAALHVGHVGPDDADPDAPDRPFLSADVANTIIYGLGPDLTRASFDDTDVYFRNCLIKSAGTDDSHFISTLWDTDPLYGTVREDYLFDYRLDAASPARGWADPTLVTPDIALDPYLTPRAATLGAYEQPLP